MPAYLNLASRRAARRAVIAALWIVLALPGSIAIDIFTDTITALIPANISVLRFIAPVQGQAAALTKSQTDALDTYNFAVSRFKSILSERRAQINSHQPLPNLPG